MRDNDTAQPIKTDTGVAISWRFVFYPHIVWPGGLSAYRQAAANAGYPYYAWNDKVYSTIGSAEVGVVKRKAK